MMFRNLLTRLRKSAPTPELIGLQNDIVRSVVGNITDLQEGEWDGREWVFLAVNHEVLVEDGRRSSTQAAVLAHRPGAELEHLDFRLSQDSKQKLLALRDAMAGESETPWTILDLTVERSGAFEFAFGYGPPPRLNGDLLHSPLRKLLEKYRETRP